MEDATAMQGTIQEAEYRVVKLEDMHPAEYNPRYDLQPGDLEYEQLRASVMANGFLQPIVWNQRTGNIVGGEQRFKVLSEMGVTEITCAVVDIPLEDEQEANINLNESQGRWEDELLQDMLSNMDVDSIDPMAMGFTSDELEHVLTGLDTLHDEGIFDMTMEPEKKPLMIKCPHCGKKFEEASNRVSGETDTDEEAD